MKYCLLVLVALFVSGSASAQQDAEEGKVIFKSRCASCHAVKRRLVGPALENVYDRRDNKWIIDFIHSSQTMIRKGDSEAVALFEEYNNAIMPDHIDLSETQINNILAYIKQQSEKTGDRITGNAVYTPPYVKPYENKNSFIDKIVYLNFDKEHRPIKKDDFTSWVLIVVVIFIIIVLLYVTVFFKTVRAMYGSGRSAGMEKIGSEFQRD